MAEEQAGWGLVLPFDSDDLEFCRGMEAGITYEAVRSLPDGGQYEALLHANNLEMAIRIGEALHRPVRSEDYHDDEWVSVFYGPRSDDGT